MALEYRISASTGEVQQTKIRQKKLTADDISQMSKEYRSHRNRLIAETDWVMLSDVNLPNIDEWLEYRQALRDITKQPSFPMDVLWPVKPT